MFGIPFALNLISHQLSMVVDNVSEDNLKCSVVCHHQVKLCTCTVSTVNIQVGHSTGGGAMFST